ncbi:MAG: anthranilate/aminodeoxychorismate synthase component II [Omnitrophica WOR_2 bacterium GWF2_38_59]|nr:MAG: anthranilate/aminodeoxychorismate synthase component II [Omnitrophica WOR_2 bacterium GWA2_37_7]OGX26607.1 MAG: anthranilate/aminodeoxychorismate synthase component II [Omnitrophica WOR_2 bacterium GWF2_38_59]OGX47732.1 MAG: anthranilate/aminodeoxychorismate synthase component II [Omnitrophica WOR_2 bacterium RIFOXYA2_FULL_38_17]OGX50422.1 MAG: anthranilate/aminodeoxychorismate synthase component II [Omnitrophica WOR_2 bacterium RIFOXYA12_FULL_38_10]OGX55771.1 MAG: anthranilate/aminodeo
MLLMIDNYDSFTYNLVQYFGELGADLKVFRNDEISIEDINMMKPEKIVISPGPGRPEAAGISVDIIKEFADKIPVLGVCLGHQAICYAYGGKIVRAKKLMHGKTSMIEHDNQGIFKDVANPFEATRYHSLVADKKTMPECLNVIARSDDGEIMGIHHKSYNLWGVQFHPESILTTEGKKILNNFLKL